MTDTAIKVENLSKRYRIGGEEKVPDTMAGALLNFLKQPGCTLRRLTCITYGPNDTVL